MPNWCENKILIRGRRKDLDNFRKSLDSVSNQKMDLSENRLKIMVLYLISNQKFKDDFLGITIMQNKASYEATLKKSILQCNSEMDEQIFTFLLRLSKENPLMTKELAQKIDEVFQKSGLSDIRFANLNNNQQNNISRKKLMMSLRHVFENNDISKEFDWDFVMDKLSKDNQISPFSRNDHFRFENYIEPSVLVSISETVIGFLKSEGSTYKKIWGTFKDPDYEKIIDNGDSIFIRYTTSWNESGLIEKAISEKFNLSVVHTYIEEGNCFCGKNHFLDGDLVDSEQDDISYKDTGEVDVESEIISPQYAIDFYDDDIEENNYEVDDFSL